MTPDPALYAELSRAALDHPPCVDTVQRGRGERGTARPLGGKGGSSVPAALTSKSTHIPFFVIGGNSARLAPERGREAVMDKVEFEVKVDCVGGGTPHVHTIVISSMGGVYHVGPTKVRLRYDCPTSGEALVASFEAPPSAGRPFKIERVN
jgi:hypothetical protein